MQLLKSTWRGTAGRSVRIVYECHVSVDAFIRDYFRKRRWMSFKGKIRCGLLARAGKYDHAENFCKKEKPVVFGLSFEKIAHADVM